MDFNTPQEASTYRMLAQVLQNHIVTQRLSWSATYALGVELVGTLAVQPAAGRVDGAAFAADCVEQLTQGLRTRQDAPPPFTGFAEEPEETATPPVPHDSLYTVYRTLTTLLGDAGAAHGLDLHGGIRIALGLLGDIMASQFFHGMGLDLDDAEAFLQTTLGPSLARYLETHTPTTMHRPWR